jgi:ankyrin repeat protein
LDSGARCEWESQGEIYSALILAASQGHVDVIEALAGAGAELDFKSGSSGISALHVAALENHLSAVKTLLRLGADVDVRNHLQMTPLHLACGAGRLEIARVLIEAGAELDGKDVDGLTAVHHAVEHPELLKMLVGEGCSLEVHDGAGNSPILFLESEELIRDLFVLAAPRDAQKKTPLMFSCVFGTTGVARMLIESGADIEAKDKEGSTALDWATKLERNDIIVCLFEAAARRGIKNDQGWIPLL